MTTAPEVHRIDALTPTRDGAYRDPFVEVRAQPGPRSRCAPGTVRTEHFDVRHDGASVHLGHRVPPGRVDDDLCGLLADELFTPGWLRGSELFERLLTGIVLTSGPDPVTSWTSFYANTLARLAESLEVRRGTRGHGTIADYAPVYAFVESVLDTGSVLELGSCFGFLALRLASSGRVVTASDVSSGTISLLETVAPRLGIGLDVLVANASRFPAPDRCADNVLLIHLLEHLDAEQGERALAEAVRLARRRVVVAVPLEDEADETWGHVRTVSLADLDAWGARSGLPYEVHEHHGGWLLVDTSS